MLQAVQSGCFTWAWRIVLVVECEGCIYAAALSEPGLRYVF